MFKSMSTLSYKCPSCGAPLEFDGREKQMTCGNCGNTFETETVIAVNEIQREDAQFDDMEWEAKKESFSPEELERTQTFSCSSCGAQLFTDETTVATSCAFCGSPSIIPAQFTPGTKPEQIIPFLIEKDQAEKMFHAYFKSRKLIPNLFLEGTNRIDEIRKLYVPYWLFSCEADARMTYRGTTVTAFRSGQYMVRTSRHFLIRRAGTLGFSALPVDASQMMDNKITESLEPFSPKDAITFTPPTLSGAQANRADVTAEECQARANDRIRSTTDQMFRRTVTGYASVIPQSSSIRLLDSNSLPVLYPIWLITTKKGDKTFTFAINGQTGELTCDIPWSKGKFFGRMLTVALGVAAAGFLVVMGLSAAGVI